MSNASLPAERPGRLDLVALILRLGLAVIFIAHGLDKIHPDNGWGTEWLDKVFERQRQIAYHGPQGDTFFGGIQAVIAWGELLGGIALALGLLTRVAAVGEVLIQAGAIVTFHLRLRLRGRPAGGLRVQRRPDPDVPGSLPPGRR